MTDFQVIEARRYHCGQMTRILRCEHRDAVLSLGMDMKRELRATFEMSYFRKAWLIDGELAGLGGVLGSIMGPYGFVWVTLSEAATKYPMAIIKEAKKQLFQIMQSKVELMTTVLPDDRAAQRLAAFLGFHVEDQGLGQPAFSRSGRRQLVNYAMKNPDFRVHIGAGYAVRFGYHIGHSEQEKA